MAASAMAASKPSLFLIVGDDMGWANAGWHSNHTLTPAMDAIVKDEAIELNRHYVFFYCSPSRSSMLTGRLPMHVTEDNDNACTQEGAVPRAMTTIAAKLMAAGYETHHIGKWHLGQNHPGSLPINRGFTHSFGYLGGAEDHYTNTNNGCGNCGTKVDLWRDYKPAKGEQGGEFAAYKYDREAVRVIKAHTSGMPLFMYLALQCAHAPNEPDRFGQLYPNASYTKDFADYNGMISAVDSAVSNVTRALKEVGLWANSLVTFTSDNGGPAAKSVSGHAANNWPLRGGKHTAWEGGHRVLAWVAGGLVPPSRRGTALDGFVHGADWYATFAGLAGVDATDDVPGLPGTDSIDMWAYLSGAVAASPRTEVPLASASAAVPTGALRPNGNGSAALIVGEYKLVRFEQQYCMWTGPVYPNASTTHAGEEHCDCGAGGCLYNIFDDPSESHDLAAKLPDVAARLRARAEALDATALDFIKGSGWRGANQPEKACMMAESTWGGFWGPEFSSSGAGDASSSTTPIVEMSAPRDT